MTRPFPWGLVAYTAFVLALFLGAAFLGTRPL
jgi:hypothetical protein